MLRLRNQKLLFSNETYHMDANSIPAELVKDLKDSKVTESPLSPGLTLHTLLAETTRLTKVKSNQRRQVFYLQTSTGQYFLKISKLVRKKDRTRHRLFPMRRWAEWQNLHRLRAKNVAAATPVLKGGKKGEFFFLVTEQVLGSQPACQSTEEAHALGTYVKDIHDKGIYHADLHPGNIILRKSREPWLIDTQEVFFLPCLPHWVRAYNLGRLFYHLSGSKTVDHWIEAFLFAYNRGLRKPITGAEVARCCEYHRQRRYRSRTKRCCKNSSEFEIVKEQGGRGYKRRDFSWKPQKIQEALDRGEWIKQDRVLRYGDLCIKVHTNRFFHKDRCLKAWKMSRALEVRNIPVPKALAYLRMAGKSYFISEFLDGIGLNPYIFASLDEQSKRQKLKELAQWLVRIHNSCVFQRDLKSNNLLYANSRFVLLGLGSVEIPRHVSEKKRIMNLAQLNASLSDAITLKDRLRFYQHYSTWNTASRKQRRTIYSKVMELTAAKHTRPFGLNKSRLLCRL